jgi:hypothetical protein
MPNLRTKFLTILLASNPTSPDPVKVRLANRETDDNVTNL